MSKQKREIPNWLSKARDKWTFNGTTRPPFAEEPKEGQVSVWDFPRPPAIEKVTEEISIFSGDKCLALTKGALAICETASPPTYYIPIQDVELQHLLKMPGKKSLCEWKGTAGYWALWGSPNLAIGWSYAHPFPPFEALQQHIAFYPQHLNCFIGKEKVRPQPGQFYAGWITDNLSGPFKGDAGTSHW